jgi:hypothetical protein
MAFLVIDINPKSSKNVETSLALNRKKANTRRERKVGKIFFID